MVFIDSMQFMTFSLDALNNNLSDNDFKYLSQEFSGDLLKLMKQKGVYPYECMDSFKKFFSEDKLPDRCELFSSWKGECISEKDYSNVTDVWKVFKTNTVDDYHDIFLKADVLLLADVFEKFISTCLDYYGLDPFRCFSSPWLSWDAMPNITGTVLELISDTDMHLRNGWEEKGMRGDISYIAKRYSKANTKYMKCCEQYKENKYIMYLYGWAMS